LAKSVNIYRPTPCKGIWAGDVFLFQWLVLRLQRGSEAANLLVKHKIGALPVVDRGKLVGIITATDLLRAFAEVLGATEEGVARIDLSLDGDSSELSTIVQLVAQENGEILGIGTYQGDPTEGKGRVVYLRLRAADANRVAKMLTDKNFTVLTVHP